MSDRKLLSSDPEVVSGTVVFAGTRVPAKALVDYLKYGHTLDEFLESFPTVEREQAQAVLDTAAESTHGVRRAPRSPTLR
jgi:uncharacterized protein (DUF433 family)